MKELFDIVSEKCSEKVTKSYSTLFSIATKMLSSSIQQDIYNIFMIGINNSQVIVNKEIQCK